MLQRFIDWFASRHLLTNLIFLAVIAFGVFAWLNLRKEELPDMSFDTVRISTSYPGASAGETEYFITRPIEDAVKGLDGVFPGQQCYRCGFQQCERGT